MVGPTWTFRRCYRPRILQANVRRSGPAHDAALQTAASKDYDIILLQEPWVGADNNQRITKSHPDYQVLAPQAQWAGHPRVLTYVRRSRGLTISQPTCGLSRDLLQIVLSGPNTPTTTIWNVYNAPVGAADSGRGLELLLQQQEEVRPNTTIAGDFNLRHAEWDHSTQRSLPDGYRLSAWADRQRLQLLNPPGRATHRAGGVLDLVFSNDQGASAEIVSAFHTTSDHETISIYLSARQSPDTIPGRFRLREPAWDTERFHTLLLHATQTASHDPHKEAEDITQALATALQGSAPRARKGSMGARWWTEECQTTLRRFRKARRMGPADTEAQAFRATAQKAKRAYWRGLVQSAASYPEIYRVVQWHKHQPRYLSPPLRAPDGTHATDPAAKSRLLQESLLHRAQMDKDIPYDTPAVPARAVPWAPIQEAEAYAATCQVSATTPGIDEIPVQAIQKAWKLLGPRITHLYQACLRQGVHPRTFKDARVVVLPKTGNRDWALPASYRPIALLSCLGKGLERLMARRLAFWAKELKILAPDQCGAISQRSATDLTTALLSDINDQWAQHRVAGMVTIDVQGAFDGVLGGRLIYRLREQGWPKEVLDWVHSFLSNRTARINLDNTTSEPFRTYGGLPQGSPVSPILFLLYIEPLLRLGKSRFGFADDACLLGSGKDLPTCGQALQKSLNGALQWGADNGIQFEISKTELQYFHRKRQGDDRGQSSSLLSRQDRQQSTPTTPPGGLAYTSTGSSPSNHTSSVPSYEQNVS